MKKDIYSIHDRIENQRIKILEYLELIPPEQLQFREQKDSWNQLQVVLHLIKAEQLTIGYIERKLRSKNSLEDSGIGSQIRFLLLRLGLSIPVKYKAPKMADVSGHYPSLEYLKDEWELVRQKLKGILDQCDENTVKKALFKHPRAGYLNLKQTLEFIELHVTHHKKQLKRIDEASKSVNVVF